MVIFAEAEWAKTNDIWKDSKNNFPFEKGGTVWLKVVKK